MDIAPLVIETSFRFIIIPLPAPNFMLLYNIYRKMVNACSDLPLVTSSNVILYVFFFFRDIKLPPIRLSYKPNI